MSIQRKIPKVLTETAGKKVEEARVENTRYGVCPVCNKQMKISMAGTHKVMVCLDHSIVMPTKDGA